MKKNNKTKNKVNEQISNSDLERFIAELDKNPRCKNNHCCDGNGVCLTIEDLNKLK